MAALSFISSISLLVVTLVVFLALILPRWYFPDLSLSFSGYATIFVPSNSKFQAKGISLIRSAPLGNYCNDAQAIILPPGIYGSQMSFLTTALRDKTNHCNTVPIEVVFSEPVRTVVVTFRGAILPYELVGYKKDGAVIRKKYRSPKQVGVASTVGMVSGKANISRITFGYESALSMIEKIEFSR